MNLLQQKTLWKHCKRRLLTSKHSSNSRAHYCNNWSIQWKSWSTSTNTPQQQRQQQQRQQPSNQTPSPRKANAKYVILLYCANLVVETVFRGLEVNKLKLTSKFCYDEWWCIMSCTIFGLPVTYHICRRWHISKGIQAWVVPLWVIWVIQNTPAKQRQKFGTEFFGHSRNLFCFVGRLNLEGFHSIVVFP